jgi:asparagine synthase (glutamine-hydrolysing)
MTEYPKFFTTFSRPDSNTLIDIGIAKKITKALQPDVRHEIIEMSSPAEESYNKIIAYKSGMNGQEVAFMIPYLDFISKWSDCSITGDGGDKFLVNLFPLMKTNNRKQLIEAIVKFNSAADILTVSKLCGVTKQSVLDRIYETLDGYDIPNHNSTYAAFLMRERGINWAFEGEDRNRFILWSTSPYYSPKVIEEAVKFSMPSKNYGRLFISLFDFVPGKLQTFLNPNWKLPPTETKKIKWVHDKQLIKSKLPKRLTERNNILFKESKVYKKWLALSEKPLLDFDKIPRVKLSTAFLNRVDTLIRISK